MDNIVELLNRLGVLTYSENRQIAGLADLKPVHLDVLRYLSRCNRYSNTPAALGQFLNTTKGTVSQSLKVLEREKLIGRFSDVKDGRVVRLKLLKKGSKLLAKLNSESRIRQAADEIGRIEQTALESGLTELLRKAQRLNDSKSFGICKTCKFFRQTDNGMYRCGVTQESLTVGDSELICIEHQRPRTT